MARLNLLEETRYEKLAVTVYPDQQIAAVQVASRIADVIRAKQKNNENAILGLATGVTPVGVYAELIRMHKEDGLSFQNVITFNLDEYYPMKPDAAQSYVTFMKENLFDYIDIKKENVHIPDGTLNKEDVAAWCLQYEKQIEALGGLDLQILGIGRTGHAALSVAPGPFHPYPMENRR